MIIYDKELKLSHISIGCLLLVPIIVCVERVYVRCHTIYQAISGIIIGYITAIIAQYCVVIITCVPTRKKWMNNYTETLIRPV